MFKLTNTEANARAGILRTSHCRLKTPFFMPVATKATAKFVDQCELLELGAQCFIANALWLSIRPGLDVISSFGGLHGFMRWEKAIFTDSGGFQILSDAHTMKVSEKGVDFRSPFDGAKHHLAPEKAIQIQNLLGGDAIMCLDDVPSHTKTKRSIQDSTERTARWAERCKNEHKKKKQLLFGITQGGTYKDLREQNIRTITKFDFDGYSLGGLCIGEPKKKMHRIVEFSNSLLPKDKPRYLMGVGSAPELLEAIERGVDIFDSVFPTRMARHGLVFTSKGNIKIYQLKYSKIKKPLDTNCNCKICKNYSLAYLHHLFRLQEPNAMHHLSYHNLYFIQRTLEAARKAIENGKFSKFKKEFIKSYRP